jgi:hypothetical protein
MLAVCPYCNGKNDVAPHDAGRAFTCQFCHRLFMVEETGPEPALAKDPRLGMIPGAAAERREAGPVPGPGQEPQEQWMQLSALRGREREPDHPERREGPEALGLHGPFFGLPGPFLFLAFVSSVAVLAVATIWAVQVAELGGWIPGRIVLLLSALAAAVLGVFQIYFCCLAMRQLLDIRRLLVPGGRKSSLAAAGAGIGTEGPGGR